LTTGDRTHRRGGRLRAQADQYINVAQDYGWSWVRLAGLPMHVAGRPGDDILIRCVSPRKAFTTVFQRDRLPRTPSGDRPSCGRAYRLERCNPVIDRCRVEVVMPARAAGLVLVIINRHRRAWRLLCCRLRLSRVSDGAHRAFNEVACDSSWRIDWVSAACPHDELASSF